MPHSYSTASARTPHPPQPTQAPLALAFQLSLPAAHSTLIRLGARWLRQVRNRWHRLQKTRDPRATGRPGNDNDPGELPSGWVEAVDPHGYLYFANPETGASQWERPTPSLADVSSNYGMGAKSSLEEKVVRVNVVCPEGSGEGDQVLVKHSGQSFEATVPQGLSAGETFQVELLLKPAPEEMMEETSEAKHGSAHGRSMWTAEEDRLISEGVCRFGLRWRQIATAYMPSRSDSSIRNRWMRNEKEKAERQKLQEYMDTERAEQKQAELAHRSEGGHQCHSAMGNLLSPLGQPVEAQAVRLLLGCSLPEQLGSCRAAATSTL